MTAKQPAAATATASRVQPPSLLQRRLPVSGTALAAGPAPRTLARSSSPLPPGEGPGVRAALPTTPSVPAPLLSAPISLQPKLTVNTPGDKYEQEADRVADMVMRMPDPMVSRTATDSLPVTAGDGKKKRVQRQCATCAAKGHTSEDCPDCKKKKQGLGGTLQRLSTQGDSAAGMAAPPIVSRVLSTPGSPLPADTRTFMESRFGTDFSHVRVHTDSLAAESAAVVQAKAYTVGNHIAFGAGITPTDHRLLAHELTHTMQQGSARTPADSIQREALLQSTIKMRHRYLEGESRFEVTKGGIVVTVIATPMSNFDGQETPCDAPPISVTLHKDRLGPDAEYGSCRFEYGKASSRSWANLPSGTYYLAFWTADRDNDDCIIEGSVEVSQFEGMTGESCTEAPPGPLEFIHMALDAAGLIPVLGAIPDGINAGIYSIEGDWGNAGFSAAAMIPFLGDAATIGKGIKGAGTAVKISSKGAEELGKAGIEAAVKEAKAAASAEKALGKELVEDSADVATKGMAKKGASKVSTLLGKTGRMAFGETRFKGLVQNRPLRDLTHGEIYQAFRDTPYELSNHAILRLKDIRTKNLGMLTLNDLARHLNNGIIANADKGAIAIQHGAFEAIINPVTRVIITLTP